MPNRNGMWTPEHPKPGGKSHKVLCGTNGACVSMVRNAPTNGRMGSVLLYSSILYGGNRTAQGIRNHQSHLTIEPAAYYNLRAVIGQMSTDDLLSPKSIMMGNDARTGDYGFKSPYTDSTRRLVHELLGPDKHQWRLESRDPSEDQGWRSYNSSTLPLTTSELVEYQKAILEGNLNLQPGEVSLYEGLRDNDAPYLGSLATVKALDQIPALV